MLYERDLESVIETIRNTPNGCALLIGAGVSVKAGIPLAAGFVDRIRQKFPAACRRAKEQTYPHCMAQLTRAERHAFVTEAVCHAKVNWAHVALAQLIRGGHITRILTTNFDPLVMRASALVGVYPAVYDLAASSDFKPSFVSEPAIFHLHGQHSGFVQLHTDVEVKKHFERLRPVFADAGSGRPWIVVGYSGDNDPVFDHLAEVQQFEHGLYWIGFRDSEPANHVRERLLDREKDAFFVRGYDADTFFVRLAQALECFPPTFIAKPFAHLKECLGELTPFELDEKPGPTIVDLSRGKLDEAISRFEAAPGRGDVGKLLAGDLDGVVTNSDGEAPSGLLVKAWALVMEGGELLEKAGKTNGPGASVLFAQAAGLYARAVDVKADMDVAWNNWGIALNNQATTESNAERGALLKAACEKYARAVELNPTMHEAWYNWGIALGNQSEGQPDGERRALLMAACEKFERAVEINEDDHSAWYNWGQALDGQSDGMPGPEKESLLERACEKFGRAVQIKPDKHAAWDGWGSALLELGKMRRGRDGGDPFVLAREKCLNAEAIRKGSGAYNLACMSALMGSEDECRCWLSVARESLALPPARHLQDDSDLDSVRSSPWFADFLGS